MRRTILCCLSLALLFTLTLNLQILSAHAGDRLPTGCCEYFSDADFISLKPGKLILTKSEFMSASAPTVESRPVEAAPVLLTYIPKSIRTWDFDYQPERPRIKLLWHTQKVSFRPKPTITIPVHSQKKHIAPVLFWGTGSVTDMTIAAKLISHQFGDMLSSGIFPTPQLPLRIVRMAKRFF